MKWDDFFYRELPKAWGMSALRKHDLHKRYATAAFTLSDAKHPETKLLIENPQFDSVFIFDYEAWRDRLDHSKALLQEGLTRRCDAVVLPEQTPAVVLCELTSTIDHGADNLQKKDETTHLSKAERAQIQLLHTALTVRRSEKMCAYLAAAESCIALLAVCLGRQNNPSQKAFNRNLLAEAKRAPRGLRFRHPELEAAGFHFYRLVASNALALDALPQTKS